MERKWNPKTGLLLWGGVLGLVAAALAFMGNPGNMAFCIACFIRDIAGACKLHTAAAVQYMRPEIAGLAAGSFFISLLGKEYRSTSGSSPMIRFLLGVVTMIGALVFLGCPLRMVLRMAAGDWNAYVGLAGFVLGAATGCFFLKKGFSLGRAYDTRKESGYILPAILAVLFLLSILTPLFAASAEGPGSMHAPALLALVVALLFGAIAQKCRTCFAGSIRDVILMRNFDLITVIGGLFAVMLVFNLATGGFKLSFAGQPVAHSQHIWNILGLYAVGFAAVLAGGCPLRQLVLAGQGSSDSAVTFLGLLVGAAFCHNFGLAASAAAAATADTPAAPGGLAMAGKVAVIGCIVILFIIGFVPKSEEGK